MYILTDMCVQSAVFTNVQQPVANSEGHVQISCAGVPESVHSEQSIMESHESSTYMRLIQGVTYQVYMKSDKFTLSRTRACHCVVILKSRVAHSKIDKQISPPNKKYSRFYINPNVLTRYFRLHT